MAVFVLALVLAALRGEKPVKICLSETRDYFREAEGNTKQNHIVLLLRGRFIGGNGEGYYCVAVTCLINYGLRLGPWVKRVLSVKEKRGRIK